MGPALPYIALALTAASTVVSIDAAQDAKTDARKKTELQKQQLAMKDRLAKAKARREARITMAKYEASLSASGATGSVVDGVSTGIETTTGAQTDLITAQSDIQSSQFDIAESQTVDAANLQIAQSVAGFMDGVGEADDAGVFK